MAEEKKTILVIEDEPAYQKALVNKLSLEGYNVLAAGNGREGLAVALEKKPDLILLDLLMPEKCGVDVLSELRKDEWGKSVKVAVLSNFCGEGPVSRVLENGVTFYFVKSDITLENLIGKIQALLS